MILLGKVGEFELTAQTVDALRLAYADKQVDRELALMHLWLLSNPARRPVKVLTFVKAWLKRARAYNPTKEARRANIAGLCGWNKRDDPASVDGTAVQPLRLELRQQGDDDVGGLPPSRHH